MTGLELRSEAAHEARFVKYSGTSPVVTPMSLGIDFGAEPLAEVAWRVLVATAAQDDAQKVVFEAAFRLDADRGTGFSERLAGVVAERWRIGPGLLNAASLGKCWLNPRCLRWIGRELAAAQAAAASGIGVPLVLSVEAQLAMNLIFPHLVEGRPVDAADVLMAAWLLHDTFIGADGWDRESGEGLLGHLSALTFSSPSAVGCLERFAASEALWAVADDEPLAGHPGWGGLEPSALRGSFARAVGVEVDEWLGGAFCVLMRPWSGANDLGVSPSFRTFGSALPESDVGRRVATALESRLAQSIDELGVAVLARAQASGGYQGLGSTSQTEWSELHDRPVVRFQDGAMMVTSSDAFARAACAIPRQVIEADPKLGGRRKVGGTIGCMFEVATTKLLSRLEGRCEIKTGADIDAIIGDGAARCDVVVADTGGVVALEFGLQPIHVDAAAGKSSGAETMIERYVSKMRQAQATTRPVEMATALSSGLPRPIGHFVVVEEPMAFTAVHCASLRGTHDDVPDLFVIGIVDLARLVDLAALGHSLPLALIGWQTGGSQLPFDHRLPQLERLTGPDRSRLTAALGRLVDAVNGTQMSEAA